MIEHGRAVVGQMLDEPDGMLGPADQSGEPPLAFDQPAQNCVTRPALGRGIPCTTIREGLSMSKWEFARIILLALAISVALLGSIIVTMIAVAKWL